MKNQKNNIDWRSPTSLFLSGTLDEFFEYGTLFDEIKTKKSITVDVSGIIRINSVGVRDWIKNMLATQCAVQFVNCPAIFVDQISMIPQFLGKHGSIQSFFCTFVCDECNEESDILYTVGKDIVPLQNPYEEPEPMECPNCRGTMNFDHDHDLYFSFLHDRKAS